MMKLLALIVVIACLYVGYTRENWLPRLTARPQITAASSQSDRILANAFQSQRSNLQVIGQGVVTTILPDDNDGDRHQRFILQLQSEQTLLVAHNIDLAPRLAPLNKGDTVQFYGEYEWNAKGGVIHWTHHDPNRRHPAGWLKHRGRMYQ